MYPPAPLVHANLLLLFYSPEQAGPPSWRSDLILAVLKRTAGLPLIRLAGWTVALAWLQLGPPTGR